MKEDTNKQDQGTSLSFPIKPKQQKPQEPIAPSQNPQGNGTGLAGAQAAAASVLTSSVDRVTNVVQRAHSKANEILAPEEQQLEERLTNTIVETNRAALSQFSDFLFGALDLQGQWLMGALPANYLNSMPQPQQAIEASASTVEAEVVQ